MVFFPVWVSVCCFSEGIFKVKGAEGALEFQSKNHGSQWQFIDLSNAGYPCRTQRCRCVFKSIRSQN